jgi:hypothetical protein
VSGCDGKTGASLVQGDNFDGNQVALQEETNHMFVDRGYGSIYPAFVKSDSGDSDLMKAMDVARGGKFIEVPDQYPADAWYTY